MRSLNQSVSEFDLAFSVNNHTNILRGNIVFYDSIFKESTS